MTPAERKRAQRQRDRLAGWTELIVKVANTRVNEVREFVASLPPPSPPQDPAQLSMLEALDKLLMVDEQTQTDEERHPVQGKLL